MNEINQKFSEETKHLLAYINYTSKVLENNRADLARSSQRLHLTLAEWDYKVTGIAHRGLKYQHKKNNNTIAVERVAPIDKNLSDPVYSIVDKVWRRRMSYDTYNVVLRP